MTVAVVYASQTGNAEEVAFSFFEQFKRSCHAVRFMEANDLQSVDASYFEVIVFFVSTTGNGDPPDNMSLFWKSILRRQLSSTFLTNVHFAVFGLGDSSYENYNVVARKLFARLQQLGGHPIVDIGLGDDQGPMGYWGAFELWKRSLFASPVLSPLLMDSSESEISTGLAGLSCRILENTHPRALSSLQSLFPGRSTIFSAKVLQNCRISASDWFQDIRQLTLKINEAEFAYEAGDVMSLYYTNSDASVRRALNLLPSKHPNAIVDISIQERQPRKSRLSFSSTFRLFEMLKCVLDICSIPKRNFFHDISHYAPTLEQKEKLIELSRPDGTELWIDYCLREKRSYIDVLEEFQIIDMPPEQWIASIPLIAPRKYSIASSPKIDPHKVELCIGIVQHVTPYGRKKAGLCSEFVSTLMEGDDVFVELAKSKIRDTPLTRSNFSVPLLCVATGTGIAPMRSILQEKIARREMRLESMALLLQGCRKMKKDDLFVDEWTKIRSGICPYNFADTSSSHGVNSFNFHIAYSQEGMVKQYVTHLIKQYANEIVALLNKDGCVVISGSSSRMPKDVISALTSAFVSCEQMNTTDAHLHISRLVKTQRIVIDTWS